MVGSEKGLGWCCTATGVFSSLNAHVFLIYASVCLKYISTLLPKGIGLKFMWELAPVTAPSHRLPPCSRAGGVDDLTCFPAAIARSPATSVHCNKLTRWVCRDMVGCETWWLRQLVLLLGSRAGGGQGRHGAGSWDASCPCEIGQRSTSWGAAGTCGAGPGPSGGHCWVQQLLSDCSQSYKTGELSRSIPLQ